MERLNHGLDKFRCISTPILLRRITWIQDFDCTLLEAKTETFAPVLEDTGATFVLRVALVDLLVLDHVVKFSGIQQSVIIRQQTQLIVRSMSTPVNDIAPINRQNAYFGSNKSPIKRKKMFAETVESTAMRVRLKFRRARRLRSRLKVPCTVPLFRTTGA